MLASEVITFRSAFPEIVNVFDHSSAQAEEINKIPRPKTSNPVRRINLLLRKRRSCASTHQTLIRSQCEPGSIDGLRFCIEIGQPQQRPLGEGYIQQGSGCREGCAKTNSLSDE